MRGLKILLVVLAGGLAWGPRAEAASISELACPPGDTPLTNAPTDLAAVAGVVPLGNLNPAGGHVLPTRHIYFYPLMTAPGDPSTAMTVPVYAPAKAELVAVEYHPDKADWSLHIRPCKDIAIYYFHLNKLSRRLTLGIGDVAAGGVVFPGPFTVKPVSIDLAAGELLGQAKTFDMGLQDFRKAPQPFINPARYAVDIAALLAAFPSLAGDPIAPLVAPRIVPQALYNRCPIDYYIPSVRAALTARLADYDGTPLATGVPKCHSHMQDVPKTAQGNWFNDLDPVHDALLHEREALALVNWNVDPAVQLFSLTDLVPGFAADALPPGTPPSYLNSVFEYPVRSGPQRSNRRFAEITDDAVYCYDKVRVHRGGPLLTSLILIRVSDRREAPRSKLEIEFVPGKSCRALPAPWTISSAAAVFYR